MNHTDRITHTYTFSKSKQVMLSIVNSQACQAVQSTLLLGCIWGDQEKISWCTAVKLIWIRPWDCTQTLALLLCGYGAVWQSHIMRVPCTCMNWITFSEPHNRPLNHAFLISWYNHIKSLKMNYIFMAKSQTNKTLWKINKQNPFRRNF